MKCKNVIEGFTEKAYYNLRGSLNPKENTPLMNSIEEICAFFFFRFFYECTSLKRSPGWLKLI